MKDSKLSETEIFSRIEIISTLDRPDLAPIVMDWLWTEFWRPNGDPIDAIAERVALTMNADLIWRCYILLENGVPLATASLALDDLDTRLDLNPWLAGVYVVPEARGKGARREGCDSGGGRGAPAIDRHALAVHTHRRTHL